MNHYGVIGNPIGHTFSPAYFRTKFVRESLMADYNAYELKNIDGIRKLVEDENLVGFNVTIPYKESIIHHLDGLDDAAAEINAVNTVKVESGKLVGYNTDWIGFLRSITGNLKDDSKAIIFGSGGSSKAVKYAFQMLGVDYQLVSRREGVGLAYEEITEEFLTGIQILINTTPLGLAPKIDECPEINYAGINSNHLCYDLIYNPEKTLFLRNAEMQGARIKNGKEMLQIQADSAWNIWNH